MNQDLFIHIVGYSASLFLILGFLPQSIVTMRTRNTEGISLAAFVFISLGAFFFVVQGWMLGNWPLVITNVITSISSIIVTVIKLQNDRRRRRGTAG